jgi:hypothetical protein
MLGEDVVEVLGWIYALAGAACLIATPMTTGLPFSSLSISMPALANICASAGAISPSGRGPPISAAAQSRYASRMRHVPAGDQIELREWRVVARASGRTKKHT